MEVVAGVNVDVVELIVVEGVKVVEGSVVDGLVGRLCKVVDVEAIKLVEVVFETVPGTCLEVLAFVESTEVEILDLSCPQLTKSEEQSTAKSL